MMTLTNELLQTTQDCKQKLSTVQTINVIECSRWHCGQPCTTEDLLRLVESKFSGTTVCIGNTDLREESFVIEGGKNLTFSSLLLSFVSMFNILYFNMSHVKINRPFSMVVSPTCLGYYKPEPDEVVEGGGGDALNARLNKLF